MAQRSIEIRGAAADDVLTEGALALIVDVTRTFRPRLLELRAARHARQARLDAGTETLHFLDATAAIRAGDWKIAEIPADLRDRRVEITGPVDAKMVINALSSGANVFMADFEDATTPTWKNLIDGQRNLAAAVRGTLAFHDERTGKHYALPEKPATLLARPRGFHMDEAHVVVDGMPVPASFFDLPLYAFHNAKALLAQGKTPSFYLPKLESHLEARLWSEVLGHVENALGIARGALKVTLLIETLPAAFEMDEFLYELKENIVGLNCGRWDYMFSTIKCLRANPAFIVPDRAAVSMEQHFLRSYTQLLIKTCHRRGAFAMGGMAAQIPIKGDDVKNNAALEKVRRDKLREVTDGHDGTWVAHPALVSIAREVFDAHLNGKRNQLDVLRSDVHVTAADLLTPPEGPRTEAGLRTNVRVGVQYLAAWLSGLGCVPIDNLMEDAATAEISRTQLWQWLKHKVVVGDGPLTEARLRAVLDDETGKLTGDTVPAARALFLQLCIAPELADFLTTPAYAWIVEQGL